MGLFRRNRKPGRARRRPSDRVRPDPAAPVEVHIMGANSIDILHARDISATGIGVFVKHRFEGCDIDSELTLVVTLPGAKSFVAKGVIKHVTADASRGYFGVSVTEISRDHRRQIATYVAERWDEVNA